MHPFWTKLNLKMHFLSAIQDAAAANRHHRAQQELTHKTTSFLKIYIHSRCLSPQDLIHFTPSLHTAGSPHVLLLFLLALSAPTPTGPFCGVKQRHLPKGSRSAGCLAQAGKLPEAALSWYSGTCTGKAGSGERGPRQTLHKDSWGSGLFTWEGAAGFSFCLGQLKEQEVHNQFWMSKTALCASGRTQVNEV